MASPRKTTMRSMKEQRIGDMHLRCGNCAKPRSDHYCVVSMQVGQSFLVCPTAVFKDPYPENDA